MPAKKKRSQKKIRRNKELEERLYFSYAGASLLLSIKAKKVAAASC